MDELTTADYVVFAMAIIASLGVGIFYAYKDRNKTSLIRYHRGDGKLKVIPVALSILVTRESSISYLGFPAEMYVYGIQYFLSTVAKAVGFLSIIYIAVPLYHQMEITSIFEYLEKRHGSFLLRRVAIFMYMISLVMYSAIVLFGASVALSAVTLIDVWVYIVGLATITVIYTALGGIKAVVFADIIQCLVMMVSIFAVLIVGTVNVGGIGNVIKLNMPSGRMRLFDFDPDPLVRNSFWALLIGNLLFGFQGMNSQATIQRLNSTKSKQDAKYVMFIFIPCYIILELLTMFEGLVAFAYFSNKRCDPLASGRITNPNQILPVTVVDLFSNIPGASGLFFAALCSASLSTLSSMYNSISAILTVEFTTKLFRSWSQERITNLSKLLVILNACVCVGLALTMKHVPGPLTQIGITMASSVSGPVTGIFLLSIFYRKSSVKGILIGVAIGFVIAFWMSIGSNFSRGTKRTPWLPLGPTDRCPILKNNEDLYQTILTNFSSNITFLNISNTDVYSVDFNTSTPLIQFISGVDRFYSISYNYFTVIAVCITVIIGLISSRIFKTNSHEPDNSTLSISDLLRSCVCPLRRTIKTRYKTNDLVEQENTELN